MFASLIILIAVPFILPIMVSYTQKKSNNSNVFSYPKFWPYFTGIFGIAMIVMFIYALLGPETFFVIMCILSIIAVLMILRLLFLSLYTANYKLVLDENEIIYRNFIGIVKRYKYEQITKIVCGRNSKNSNFHEFRIHIGRKISLVDPFQYNFANFEKTIKKRLREAKHKINFKYG